MSQATATVPPDRSRLLDADQALAVHAALGQPLLVVAGPGAGKTRVLTERIIHLVSEGHVAPDQVAAITFTNAAAAEMAARVEAGLPPEKTGVRISTIHALAAQIVRAHSHVVGLDAEFSIFNTDDQLRIARAATERSGIEVEPAELVRRIGTAKANLEDSSLWKISGEDAMALAFDAYEQELVEANALDFEGLVRAAAYVLSRESIATGWRANVAALLVDEFHDVSESQFAVVRLLMPHGIGLTAVGDDDQIVYAWRGADPEFMVDFERYFPGARIVVLRHNYRSTPGIVDCAARLIEHNEQRRPKEMEAAREGGLEPTYQHFDNEQAEAEAIAAWVETFVAASGSPGELGVLFRMRNLPVRQELEVALASRGIPYVTLGERTLWERPEVRDCLAWLHLTVNPVHSPAFGRALESCPGLGPAAVRSLANSAKERSVSYEVACMEPEAAGLTGKRADAARSFGRAMAFIRAATADSRRDFKELVGEVIQASGVPERLKSKGKDGNNALEAVRQLFRAASAYQARCEDEDVPPRLSEFLQDLALQSADAEQKGDSVSLGTVHAVKGLEFSEVWLAGLEEGVLPSMRSLQEGRTEEERRLCYVALTRARDNLTVSSAARRWGRSAKPSRFIAESGL
jgi:DNA helicase II / ATP-dependent DNA helicase PcrA